VSCTSVGPVNMSCQSGWPCWVCHVVGSMIHPGHFILMCLLGVSVLCYHFFFHLTICVAKWTIDLQALFVAHTRHVVLLPIQPHFCVVLIHSPCEGSRDVQNVPIMRRRPSAVDSFKIARATQATLVMMVDTVQRV